MNMITVNNRHDNLIASTIVGIKSSLWFMSQSHHLQQSFQLYCDCHNLVEEETH